MKVLIGCSEMQPFSKTGGLADVTAALGKYLGVAGVRVGVVTPLYRGILEAHKSIRQTERVVTVKMGSQKESGRIYECKPSENLTIYFVDHQRFFERDGIYGERNTDYADNAERFLFFNKVLLELSRQIPWRPDIFHVHDWPAAMLPALLKNEAQKGNYLAPPKTLFTVHNLAYQGLFPAHWMPLTNLPPEYFAPTGMEFYGQLSFLKAGIVYADYLSTVSPSYAKEILSEEFGCGLQGVLGERRDRLSGILNGVDYAEWNTANNPHLEHSYSSENMRGKAAEKKRLQRDLGFAVDAQVPLFGIISRLVEQKGIALLAEALRQSLQRPMQFVLLGSGEPTLERMMQELARQFPTQVGIKIGYHPVWAHRIEAACDFYLMPSRFEPCGLNQLYSQRYGTIPIVRAVGGLCDSVQDESEGKNQATGVKFAEFTVDALLEAICRAMKIFQQTELFRAYRRRAMSLDFSWKRATKAYLDLYQKILRSDASS